MASVTAIMATSGKRMKKLRRAAGFKNAYNFAKFIDVSAPRWSNVENGYPISRDVANKIKKKLPGVDLDYIYDGEKSGLSLLWLQRLDEIPGDAEASGLKGITLR